ncbi:MAG: hypothetical protein IJM37_02400 [Lachnospiraceae bacterium]|nr:hypothetical protein [Lachnospiraceae bacterium]
MFSKNDKGSFTIEASLTLSVFLFAFVSIIRLAAIARLEGVTQYAIDQAAIELSKYCYTAEKLGLMEADAEDFEKNSIVEAVADFSDIANTTVKKYKTIDAKDIQNVLHNYDELSEDIMQLEQAADTLYNSLGAVMEEPEEMFSFVTSTLLNDAADMVKSRVLGQLLCRIIVPQYITASKDPDAYLEKMGVEDGVDRLDFRMSDFLGDGRSINIVLVYRVKTNGYGIFNNHYVIKQTASTAAWVKGQSLQEIYELSSIWDREKLERGKEFVAVLKGENPKAAVKGGVGIDMYDINSDTYTSVNSVNVFMATYSTYKQNTEATTELQNYSLKKSRVKSVIKEYAKELTKSVDKINSNIEMEDGTELSVSGTKDRKKKLLIILPEEADDNENFIKILDEISSEINKETGVLVKYEFREKALGGSV